MPRTNKKYFEKDFKKEIWDSLLREIKNSKNGSDLDILLNKYLTQDEKILLEKRLGIFKLLKEGLSYRKISEKIDVTRTTISFAKRGFKKPKRKRGNNSRRKSAGESFFHKKNSVFPTYVGKGRWKI